MTADEGTGLLVGSSRAAEVSLEFSAKDSFEDDAPSFSSLDFDKIINSYSIAATRARHRKSQKYRRTKHERSEELRRSSSNLSGKSSHHKEKEQVVSDRGVIIARWMMIIMVGVCTGLTAVTIIFLTELLIEFRVSRLNRQLQWASGYADEDEIVHWYHHIRFFDIMCRNFGVMGVYLFYSIYNLILVLSSATFVLLFAPQAAGSGIPEVKAYLNGIRVPTLADMRLFFIKAIGTILAVSSGLVVGPEGPVVHLGAIIGASMTKTGDMEGRVRLFRKSHPEASKCLGCADYNSIDEIKNSQTDNDGTDKKPCWKENGIISALVYYLSQFRNDLERRHLISIGAACGFASAFGAPVGGLLYSMEEASSFFSHDMLWKTLTATALSTCIIAMYHGDFTRYSMLSLEIGDTSESLLARFSEVPLYFVMGTIGGIVGATYNNIYEFMQRKRSKFYNPIAQNKGSYVGFKLLECGLISVLTSILMLSLPLYASWACRDIDNTVEEFDPGFLHRYNCAPGQVNEIGSILFGSREESIKDILTNPEEFQPETLLSVGLLFLGLMLITFGVALPTGMFMPTVLTGASLGGYAGLVFKTHFISSVHPSDFALIGGAAFLAGMQRNTVSLCVILMEGTSQTKALIPVIITVVCARAVGDLFSEGVYEIGMELKHYPYLEHETKPEYDMYTAADVMTKPVETFSTVETAAAVESRLLKSKRHAFPVLDAKTGHYKGMVRRDQLIAAIECKIFTSRRHEVADDTDTTQTNVSNAALSAIGEDLEDTGSDGFETWTPHSKMKRYKESGFIYRSVREGQTMTISTPEQWRAGRSELISPWLRDNVLVSDDGTKIMFGMDETLPDGMVENHSRTIVKVVDDKLVVLVPLEDRDKQVDIGSIMNRSAFAILEDCPLSRTYQLFASMGLRHLPVLSNEGEVVGMITRYNLSEEHVDEKTRFIS